MANTLEFFYKESLFQPASNFLIFCLFQPQKFLKFCPGPDSDSLFFPLQWDSNFTQKSIQNYLYVCVYCVTIWNQVKMKWSNINYLNKSCTVFQANLSVTLRTNLGSINIICAAGDFLQPSRGFQTKRSAFSLKFIKFPWVSASAIS